MKNLFKIMKKAVMKKKKIDVEKSFSFDRDDIFSIKHHLTKKGYFSNDKEFKTYEEGILNGVRINQKGTLFTHINNSNEIIESLYFIPETGVVFAEETKEKKLRPYKSISEFCVHTGCREIGKDLITIRNKNTQKEYELSYIGYSDGEVHLGGYILTFADLLKNYEYALNSFEWLPFGVEE